MRNLYYVRIMNAEHADGTRKTTEWYGPIIAFGPYTAGYHIAKMFAKPNVRTAVDAQIISERSFDKTTYQINFPILNTIRPK